ncbi:Conserved_hypothetical protein [Hexamita inflata]|uniref:Uncharacterized protein n=1 Tax=Hexamita inflata TaxID=28002 RepID=A0AA86UCS5_9EUKA|nr:Conserved hypothetical protein [Hexamita inflata]
MNANILYGVSKIQNFVFSGLVTAENQISLFSLVLNDKLTVESCNISIQQTTSIIRCAALLLNKGALSVNNSLLNFEFVGQQFAGLSFSSLTTTIFNCNYSYSIISQTGAVFSFYAQNNVQVTRFTGTGSFQTTLSPKINPNLIQIGTDVILSVLLVQIEFSVQTICTEGKCELDGIVLVGVHQSICDLNTDYCDLKQVIFGDFHTQSITVGGQSIESDCIIEAQLDLNSTYTTINVEHIENGRNSSLFCNKKSYINVVVTGSYTLTNNLADISSGSIFMAKQSTMIMIQQCKIDVTLKSTNQAAFSLFILQDINYITVNNSIITISIQVNEYVSFHGISENIDKLIINTSQFDYFTNGYIDTFCGLAYQMSLSSTLIFVNSTQLQLNILAQNVYGLSYSVVSSVNLQNVTFSGTLQGNELYGLFYYTTNVITLQNIKYSLKLNALITSCGFIQIINNVVNTNNIIFTGYDIVPSIPATFGSSSQCPCIPNAYLVNGLCQCNPGYVFDSVRRSCDCPGAASDGTCVCPIPNTFWTGSTCQCTQTNAYINFTTQQCVCPTNSIQSAASCDCPSKSELRGNVCLCTYQNAFINGATCECGQFAVEAIESGIKICKCPENSLLENNICTCKVKNSGMSGGKCVCNTLNAFINLSGVCACPINSFFNVNTNTCVCPTDSLLIDNVCKCTITNALPDSLNKTCICPTNAVLQGSICQCPTNSVLIGSVCKCSAVNAFPNGLTCQCAQYASETVVNGKNTCVCPDYSVLENKICKCTVIQTTMNSSNQCACNTKNAFIKDNQCTCSYRAVNESNTCLCPTSSVSRYDSALSAIACKCTDTALIIINNACKAPLQLGTKYCYSGRLSSASFPQNTGVLWNKKILKIERIVDNVFPYLMGDSDSSALGWIDDASLRASTTISKDCS